MPKKFYYKVVRVIQCSGELRSAVMYRCNKRSPLSVCYKQGEWVRPKIKGSKLLVFKDMNCAIGFASNIGPRKEYEIFKCEIKNPKTMGLLMPHVPYESNLQEILLFWKYRTHPYAILNTPRGTIGVDAVKLVEKMS